MRWKKTRVFFHLIAIKEEEEQEEEIEEIEEKKTRVELLLIYT